MEARQSTTIEDLLLEASRAELNESMHWPRCRARGRLDSCASCDAHADRVLAADQAIRHFFAELRGAAR